MIHPEWIAKLDAYLDGELPGGELQECDRHLRECAGCAAEGLRRLQWKRNVQSAAARRYVADPALRERIQKKIAAGGAGRLSWRWWPAFALPLLVLLLLAGAAVVQHNTRRVRNHQILGEIADLHVSTLASANPLDVVSTDRHTVKPWFEGKIPFTFNLPELQGTPFELLGGRVVYLEQSPGAELIFRIRKHEISAFILQERVLPSDFAPPEEMEARSFHLQTWRQGDLRYFVISDVGVGDLRELSERLKKAQ